MHKSPSLVLLGLVVCIACNDGASTSTSATATAAPSTPPTHGGGPVFVEDDEAEAFSAAKAAGRVVFVDAWAPWCHTCLSMQRDVLSHPSLRAFEDRVTFLAVDTDRPENAGFLARFSVKLWPTFFVIDPQTDVVLGVHPGSMSLQETTAFLHDALAARDPQKATDPRVRALLAGHKALAQKDLGTAAARYADAAKEAWSRRAEAILGGLRALSSDPSACVDFGLKHMKNVHEGGGPGDVVASLVSCALKLPPTDGKRIAALAAARARLEELAAHPAQGASVDDRADVLAQLADRAQAEGDAAVARKAHEERLALLEADARAAPTVEAARVHDYARMNSYLALGRGEEAVKMLSERTAQLPSSYEAWARLASTTFQLKRFTEARVAVDKAIALSYGTRRLRYLSLAADIAAGQGDTAAERAYLQRIVDDGDKLPAALGAAPVVASARERLAQGGRPSP